MTTAFFDRMNVAFWVTYRWIVQPRQSWLCHRALWFPVIYAHIPGTKSPRWRCSFYTMKRWKLAFHRWRDVGFIGRPPYDSPPRSFDATLSIGPMNWRIGREHPWAAPTSSEGGTNNG